MTLTLTWQKSLSNLLKTFNGSWQRKRAVWTIVGLPEHMRHFRVLKESVRPRCRLLNVHPVTISTTRELCKRFFNASSHFYHCTMSLVIPLMELWLEVNDIIRVKCGPQQMAFENNHWAYLYMVYGEGASMRRASAGEAQEPRLWNLVFAQATPLRSPEDADGNSPNASSWDPFSLDSISQQTSALARSIFPLGFAVHGVSWGLIHCSYLLMKPKQLS